MTRTILLAGIYHETNTFLGRTTTREDFLNEQISRGAEIITRNQDDGSPLDGFLEFAGDTGWEVIPSIYMRAMPSGTVAQDVVDEFMRTITEDLRDHRRGLDGIYFVFHGAMVSTAWDDVEGEILERVQQELRQQKRDVPVCGVLDLHCNYTPALAAHSSCLAAYRRNPHTDARAAAIRGAKILRRLIEEDLRPRTYYQHPPLLFSPQGTGTAANPMKAVLDRIDEIESRDKNILCLNALGGFSYADVPAAGFSVTCTTLGDEAGARAYLEELCAIAEKHREEGHPQYRRVDEVLRELSPDAEGPILLVEPSDNIGAGTPGDGTGALGPLLGSDFKNIVGILNDPEAVKRCQAAGIGGKLSLQIGGKTDDFHGSPVAVEAEVIQVSDGVFALEDKQSHLASMIGATAHMGPCATIKTRNATLLLTTRATPPFDLGQLRSQGIAPEAAFIIVVKAAIAHQRAYDPIAKQSYHVDTPGLATGNLRALPYKKIKRPIFPLDT